MNFLFSPILGKLSDKVGRKPVLLISILSSIIGYLLFAFANSFWILLLSRIVAGAATERAVAGAYVADITSSKKRASGMGKVGAAYGAGFIIGPAIAGFLIIYGYLIIGIAAVILTFFNFLFVLFFLPESFNKNIQIEIPFDSISYLSRIKSILSRTLIRNLLIISFLFALAFSAVPVIMPLIGESLFGFGEVENSYIFMYIGIVNIIFQGVLIGRLTEKFGEEKLLVIFLLITAFGLFFVPLVSNIGLFFLSITMIASGSGMIRTLRACIISNNTSENEQGSVIGLAWSVASIARVPGPIISGFLFEFSGNPIPFFTSSAMFILASIIGYKTFYRHFKRKKG
jgi:MFS family permease